MFGATNHNLVHYVSSVTGSAVITANATTRYTLNFIDLSRTAAGGGGDAGADAEGLSVSW